jgi:hypothetical protein
MLDVLIRVGMVADDTGDRRHLADVATEGDRVLAMRQ